MKTLYLGICIALFCQASLAASFDCHKAQTFMEKSICKDKKLSRIDDALNEAYKQGLETSPTGALKESQKFWLSSEIADCTDVICLEYEMLSRLQLLMQVAPKGEISSTWNGQYFRVSEANRSPAFLVVVGLKGNQLLLKAGAAWMGPPGTNSGPVSTGDIDGVGVLKADRAFWNEKGCSAQMLRKGDVIVVEIEAGCGGHNVSFEGEYRQNNTLSNSLGKIR